MKKLPEGIKKVGFGFGGKWVTNKTYNRLIAGQRKARAQVESLHD